MARSPDALQPLSADANWTTTTADGRRVWTDDFSNVWSALKQR